MIDNFQDSPKAMCILFIYTTLLQCPIVIVPPLIKLFILRTSLQVILLYELIMNRMGYRGTVFK